LFGVKEEEKCTKSQKFAKVKKLENSKLINGLSKRRFYTAGIQPVYGGYYDFLDEIPLSATPSTWKNLPIVEVYNGRFKHSLRLRYTVRALAEILREKGQWQLAAATVAFSSCVFRRT